MEKVCFQLQVKPDRIEEYKSRHKNVWNDLLLALAETGWKNYSLFLRKDGLLIGYFETENLQKALFGMSQRDVNRRWQAEMADFFQEIGGQAPDENFLQLEEIFNLENQLVDAT